MKAFAFALLATALASISGAGAQTYPSRPITINVPYAAGGPLDATMRVLAEGLREVLGQSIIIENVGGAGGSIGVGRAVRAAPDGYTISAGNWASHVATGAIYSLPFDLLKDLEPVSLLPDEADLILSRKGFPAKDLKELIAWLKANPGKASAGTSGIGGPSYMSALFFEKVTDTRIQLVPYRGAGPALQDLVAGQVDFMITGPAVALPQVREGNIRAYAVTAKNRLPTAPEIPTTDESRIAGLLFLRMDGAVGAEGYAKGDHSQAERGRPQRAQRSGDAPATGRART